MQFPSAGPLGPGLGPAVRCLRAQSVRLYFECVPPVGTCCEGEGGGGDAQTTQFPCLKDGVSNRKDLVRLRCSRHCRRRLAGSFAFCTSSTRNRCEIMLTSSTAEAIRPAGTALLAIGGFCCVFSSSFPAVCGTRLTRAACGNPRSRSRAKNGSPVELVYRSDRVRADGSGRHCRDREPRWHGRRPSETSLTQSEIGQRRPSRGYTDRS